MLNESLLKDVEIKKLLDEEKTARLESEFAKSTAVCPKILKTLFDRGDFNNFLALLDFLTGKRNQSREATIAMIKYCQNDVLPLVSESQQIELLDHLIKSTDGKIFVEREFALAVRKKTEIHFKKGELEEAAKLIQDIQIETFGSLERSFKVDYILFQMRILLAKKDYVRMLLVSNKIHKNHLDDDGFEKLKVDFYSLMIEYYVHDENFIEVSKCYKILYDFVLKLKTKVDKKEEIKTELIANYSDVISSSNLVTLFENYVLYLSVCPPELETKNMMVELSLKYKKELDQNESLLFIVTKRLSDDLIVMNSELFAKFEQFKVFFSAEKMPKIFRKYWIQHDLLIFEKFFAKMNMGKIATMIAVTIDEVESEISDMVINGYIYAKINRIERTVNFRKKTDHHDILNELSYDMGKMLKGIENTCHLINKEYLKYGIKQ